MSWRRIRRKKIRSRSKTDLLRNTAWWAYTVHTSGEEFHNEVEVDGVLEGVEHLDHPLVVRLHQNIPLSPHVGNLKIPVASARDLSCFVCFIL